MFLQIWGKIFTASHTSFGQKRKSDEEEIGEKSNKQRLLIKTQKMTKKISNSIYQKETLKVEDHES